MPGGQVRGSERSELLLLHAKSGPSSAFGTFSPLAGRRRGKNLSPLAGRRRGKNLSPRAGRRRGHHPRPQGERLQKVEPKIHRFHRSTPRHRV